MMTCQRRYRNDRFSAYFVLVSLMMASCARQLVTTPKVAALLLMMLLLVVRIGVVSVGSLNKAMNERANAQDRQ